MTAKLRHVAETASTNDDVRGWIMSGTAHGAGLLADAQSAGRGRLGRTWYSPPGESLYLSVAIVGGRFTPLLPMIPLAVGVAAAQRLRAWADVGVGLKWPNDLWLGDLKLGGILCEGVFVGERYAGAVVGIGVNVNTDPDRIPSELRSIMTSVRAHTGRRHEVRALAEQLRADIVRACDDLIAVGVAPMIRRWRTLDVTTGRQVRLPDESLAEVLGIADDGGLRVRSPRGTEVMRSGEVRFV